MPRGKIEMSLIGDARDRAKAFKRRKAGLVKKAKELAKLCDVDIALVVCAGPDGGAPAVWESDPGVVIDRYRRLPADKRAKHTHLDYINGQLGKEERRLDKKRRQGLKALACPGEAVLKDMDLEELLASIDAALLATTERQKALGVADDDGQQLGQQVSSLADDDGQGGPSFVGGDDLDDIQAWLDELMWDGAEPLPLNASMMQPASGAIQYNNGNDVDMVSNHQCQAQMLPGNGENGHGQFPWRAYQPHTTVSHPDYHGFQSAGNNYVDMDEYSEMLVPSNANAYDGWYDQAWWGADDESSCAAVAVLPAAAAAAYPSLDIAGNPAYMPPSHEHPSMAFGDLMDAGRHEYETGCLADYLHFQCPDASQHFGAKPEPLHYLTDMAQGIRYNNDLEAGSCSSGRAQLFAQSHSCSGTPQFRGSEQSQGHQYQDPGVQHFWVMEEPPRSTEDVATASARARGGGTWANSGGLHQPWIPVYQ
ncbi:hypothetical protein SORBI_3003G399166 [Sorghum bicolor]|uniref:MADS-box domain-containing protein n=1 Tax=Sorghum bicolor TaxID=4558 RepID=A0A1W0W136_SORBI|nr:hypothetical protein SORBI_3003G399166 [Sorghum bicolor]